MERIGCRIGRVGFRPEAFLLLTYLLDYHNLLIMTVLP